MFGGEAGGALKTGADVGWLCWSCGSLFLLCTDEVQTFFLFLGWLLSYKCTDEVQTFFLFLGCLLSYKSVVA